MRFIGRPGSCCAAGEGTYFCHPEAVESSAKPRTPNEGPLQVAGTIVKADVSDASESIGPSARKERGSQDNKRSDCPFRNVIHNKIANSPFLRFDLYV